MLFDAILSYLLDRQLLIPDDLSPTIRVDDMSRRNEAYAVRIRPGHGLFVKISGGVPELFLRREGAFLSHIQSCATCTGFRIHAPRVISQHEGMMAVELFQPMVTVTKLHLNGGRVEFPTDLAKDAAEALARLHLLSQEGAHHTGLRPRRPLAINFPVATSRPTAALFRDALSARGLRGWASRRTSARARFHRGRDAVHGDLRWDNILFAPAGDEDELVCRLIDYELSGVGDGIYDVATWLAEYVRFYVTRVAALGLSGDPNPKVGFARTDWHDSARAFVAAYVAARYKLSGGDPSETREALRDYLPHALLLVAWELARGSQTLSPTSVAVIGVLEAFEESRDGLEEFFGV